jgi:hypothetical protein
VTPRLVVLGLLCAGVVAGCGSSARISGGDVKRLVLTQADLPGFAAFAEGATSRLDTQGTVRGDLQRFGRRSGWVARFKRVGDAGKAGPALIVSMVDVFKSPSGARADLNAYRDDFARLVVDGLARRVAVQGLGDEVAAAELLGPGKTFVVAWREANATSSVSATTVRKLSLGAVLRLARRQEAKLARAH